MSQNKIQSDFYASLDDPLAIWSIFNHLTDVFFFVKDTKSRLIAASRSILDRLNVKNESDIIGTNDDDFFPEAIANSFREDDRFVFSTGTTLHDRLEAWYDEKHNFDWFLTTKVPLRGRDGSIIGLIGVTRRAGASAQNPFSTEAETVMKFIEKNADRILTTAEVAEACGFSERTLNRRIQQSMGTTPYELMLQIRIRKAAESLITTPDSILAIAKSHGFCDQSTFTQHFRKRTGLTPKQFRKRHR
jgi:AraC-like DNA-binding protein